MKLDLGCGKNKLGPDWTGVDSIAFPGVDVVVNLAQRIHGGGCLTNVGGRECNCDANRRDRSPPFAKWPWPDDSIDEVRCSHFVEHLEVDERIHFVNELWRVLKPEASAAITTPYGFSERAFGDLTHKWPPVHMFWFLYLDANWRAVNAPHNAFYTCNFYVESWPVLRPELQIRSQEYQQAAYQEQINAALDINARFVKKPMPKLTT